MTTDLGDISEYEGFKKGDRIISNWVCAPDWKGTIHRIWKTKNSRIGYGFVCVSVLFDDNTNPIEVSFDHLTKV